MGPFEGRSISVVRDLSPDEQLYLYQKAKEIKTAIRAGGELEAYRIKDLDLAVYLMFLEDSTRTKESFRNAARFHRVTVIGFDAGSSSFNKNESLTDTIKMLVGYNQRTIFVMRTTLEGVVRHMETYIGEFARRNGIWVPSFINAGDGRHEHPTQEFLDEFTFLENLQWQRESIHLAMIGDLFHGRTVHSKVEGLRIFDQVKIDLIAPEELEMPQQYFDKMLSYGYKIRKFRSIDEYLKQNEKAKIWYFTRLQLERMGDRIRDKEVELRQSVTLLNSHLALLPDGTKIYHPLPQNRLYPEIPEELAWTSLNGWDVQSQNGYFMRIALLGLVSGKLGDDFQGRGREQQFYEADFINEVAVKHHSKREDFKTGIKLISDGTVIDHIGTGLSIPEIWKLIDLIRRKLSLDYLSSHGVFTNSAKTHVKGIISIPGDFTLNERQVKMLAALSPGCTVNTIWNNQVVRKIRLSIPPRIYNFSEAVCKNENCISRPNHREPVKSEFFRSKERDTFICKYCEREHRYREIWEI